MFNRCLPLCCQCQFPSSILSMCIQDNHLTRNQKTQYAKNSIVQYNANTVRTIEIFYLYMQYKSSYHFEHTPKQTQQCVLDHHSRC